MPTLINNILYVSVAELTDHKIAAENTIWRGLKRQRNGEVFCWAHERFKLVRGEYVQCTGREGNVFVVFESLRDKYKILVQERICDGIDPYLFIETQESRNTDSVRERFIADMPSLLEVSTEEISRLSKMGYYTPAQAQQIARGAAWLRLMNNFTARRIRENTPFEVVEDFRGEVLKCVVAEQQSGQIKFPREITCLRPLQAKAKQYAKDKLECLVSGLFGNSNRELIDNEAHKRLMQLIGLPIKLSFEDVAQQFNKERRQQEKDPVTVAAVRMHLNKPKYRRTWWKNRHGEAEGRKEFDLWLRRSKASFADALWTLDGTALQVYHTREDGKKVVSDLYIDFMFDVYSHAIVGYSLAFSETAGMVIETIKNSIKNTGHLPYQIQYDNSSANKSGAVTEFMSTSANVSFPCEPYNSKAKYAETLLGHFERQCLSNIIWYKGGNITAKSLNTRANEDLLKHIKKESLWLSQDQTIEMVKDLIAEWNNTSGKRDKYGERVGHSRIETYNESVHEKRRPVDHFAQQRLFMQKRPKPARYGNYGIKIKINKREYFYLVPDTKDIDTDFVFRNNHFGEYFDIHINEENKTYIQLYKDGKYVGEAYERRNWADCVADLEKGEVSDRSKVLKMRQEWNKEGITEMDIQLAQIEALKANGTTGMTDITNFSLATMSKDNYNTIEKVEVDRLNGGIDTGDGLSELQRKLLSIGG